MTRRMIVVLLSVLLVVAAVPGVAAAEEGAGGPTPVYLSLGDSLAAGSLADANGDTTFSSNKSYTDRLYKKIKGRARAGLVHAKLGCDGEKTTDMIFGGGSKCSYGAGTQLAEAVEWLTDPDVHVVLVSIDIGANDINHIAGECSFDPACIVPQVPGIVDNVGAILWTLRGTGYASPIIGMNYYNPNVAASVGFFPGAPGPLAPDPGFAALTDALAQAFNGGLATVYGLFGAQVADVYGAFAAGDFGDDGGRYQKKGNGVADNADVTCRLTSMCPKDAGVRANIHPTKKGYKVISREFLKIVRTLDLGG